MQVYLTVGKGKHIRLSTIGDCWFVLLASASQNTSMDTKKALGRAIRELREARDMTQTKVSDLADIGAGRLSRIEAGEQGVSIESLARIAAALSVPVSQIWATAEAGRVHAVASLPAHDPLHELKSAVGVLINLLAESTPEIRQQLFDRLSAVALPGGDPWLHALVESTAGRPGTTQRK
jgi:transcriptional regulator with XRE-family HTH domain